MNEPGKREVIVLALWVISRFSRPVRLVLRGRLWDGRFENITKLLLCFRGLSRLGGRLSVESRFLEETDWLFRWTSGHFGG